jgi:hypothetical protein
MTITSTLLDFYTGLSILTQYTQRTVLRNALLESLMAKRKKDFEETYETADGFQIEDMEGNVLDEELPEDEEDSFWSDDEEEKEEDDFFSSVAEENNWEEGYDY